MGLFKRWAVNLIFILTGLVYLLGLFVEILEIDSAQYAALSREMVEGGSFLEVYQQGRDYLDKPPFLFWLNSASFYLFGYAAWSFKLGSVLFSAVGVIATYKLGNLLYNKRIGFVAALMLMSSLAFVLMNNDVRTDTILTSAVVIAVWKLTAYLYYKRKRDLIWGFIAIAIAMMTKGPLGLLIPLMALGSYTIGRQKYKDLFRYQWVLGILLVAVLLIPMSYGLYTQFDAHPEKVVYMPTPDGLVPQDSLSGLKFFYWDQSFGRITGDNPWHNNAGPFFFVHTFLWSFFPWSLLAVWAFFWRVVGAINSVLRREKKQEWLTLGGFILPIIALSLSQYKLPHYIYVVLPFAAIFTSEFTLRIAYEKSKGWYNTALVLQGLSITVVTIIGLLIGFYVFPDVPWSLWLVFGTGMVVALYFFFKGLNLDRLVLSSSIAALTGYAFINGHYFPNLTDYQPTDEVAKTLKGYDVSEDEFFIDSKRGRFSMAYFTGFILNSAQEHVAEEGGFKSGVYIYVDERGKRRLDESGVEYTILQMYPSYPVTMPTPEFLNNETRKDAVEETYLLLTE
ncbi:ArnT family glycosyltransferase [Phaeocystidibacter luteus]|uniref:Glycosyltransferase family 39 protein n=1 Tax=Phaeocystidibacter luteus TaxID=911197 RepID=A0A6N6RM65_9FLAO|nr:glycosyltransferase family 39 protein [Phaeocystidibacter luteus]KAB2814642.1 glycosyltransferase family 39 protein [Phaeocystidibacter luteus]